jgi:hypothetical protein
VQVYRQPRAKAQPCQQIQHRPGRLDSDDEVEIEAVVSAGDRLTAAITPASRSRLHTS